MNRIVWIDMLRGFCMIAILWFHSEMYYASYEVIPYDFFVQNALAAFFFLSGYLFLPLKKKSQSSNSNCFQRLSSRLGQTSELDGSRCSDNSQFSIFNSQFNKKFLSIAKGIILPYFIYASLLVVPKTLAHGEPLSYLLIYDIICGYSYWFIAALATASILFGLLLALSRQNQAVMAIVAIVSLILSNYIGNNTLASPIFYQADLWHINEALLAMPIMCLGYFYRRYENQLQFTSQPFFVLSATLLFVLLKIAERKMGTQMVFGTIHVSHYPLFLLDLLLGITVYVGIFRLLPRISFVTWTGRHSLVYYFFCGAVPMAVSMLFNRIGFPYADNYLRLIIVFVCVYIISSFIVAFIYRYLPFTIGKKNSG